MKNRKLLILFMSISMLLAGCGTNTTNNIEETETIETSKNDLSVVDTEVQDTESSEEQELKLKEYDYSFEDRSISLIGTPILDSSTFQEDIQEIHLKDSVDLYIDENLKVGYTKPDIDIYILGKTDGWYSLQVGDKRRFAKMDEVDKSIEQSNESSNSNEESKTQESSSTSETTKKDTSTKKDTTSTKNESTNTNNNTSNNNTSNTSKQEQPTNSEPKVEESDTTFNIDYTPEEALAYYRSQVEAQGMKWDPSIKDVVSWGTGFLPLSKDELNDDYIANAMAGYNYGSGVGTPFRTHYMEIISGEVVDFYGIPSVEVIEWVCD